MSAHRPLWRQAKPEWNGPQDGDLDAYLASKRLWTHSIRQALSLGKIGPQAAANRGYNGTGHDADYKPGAGWQPLPARLFHVTSNCTAVLRKGLKSRVELSETAHGGLGGGEDDTISFTTDYELAEAIHSSLLEMRLVMRGERRLEDMFYEAKTGLGADRPYWHDILRAYGASANPMGDDKVPGRAA